MYFHENTDPDLSLCIPRVPKNYAGENEMSTRVDLETSLQRIIVIRKAFDEEVTKITRRMNYEEEDQKEESFWRGEYCGLCKDKSRSYEGGKCNCYYQIKAMEIVRDSQVEAVLKEVEKHVPAPTPEDLENQKQKLITAARLLEPEEYLYS